VEGVTQRTEFISILTFDEGGVSGHPNHIAVSKGMKLFATRHKDGTFALIMMFHSSCFLFLNGDVDDVDDGPRHFSFTAQPSLDLIVDNA
tara:strand:- start:4445 stop:4714 length:270 start_codon:yes stop_codon:yes gene_type:complete